MLIADKYDATIAQIREQVANLELENIRNNTGICHLVTGSEQEMVDYINELIDGMAKTKHANHKIAEKHIKLVFIFVLISNK